MNLPAEFLDNMRTLLGDEFDSFVQSYDEDSFSGIRVNTGKISVDDFIKISPYYIERIPYVDNGFYINDADAWSKHPYYFAGLYYIQEPSAMLPANRLPVEPGDKLLDLCAAPGGKATELAAKGGSLLVANDISFSRTIPLVKNLQIAGADNLYVINENPVKLSGYFNGFFDKILVDAPCSGEGMFRKDKDLVQSWIKKGPGDYIDVQFEILDSALKMLAPDGMLLFSTCTFSKDEDEGTISRILDRYSELELADIKPYEGFSSAYDECIEKCPELRKCIHVFPHRMNGEGHFLALIKKRAENVMSRKDCSLISDQVSEECKDTKKNKRSRNSGVKSTSTGAGCKRVPFSKLPDEVKNFINDIKSDKKDSFVQAEYIVSSDGMVLKLPYGYEHIADYPIHFIRTGLLIGNIGKNGGFTPHTAFALSLTRDEYSNTIDFEEDDFNIIKYLRGETLILEEELTGNLNKGFVLICVSSFPLGFAKYDGTKLKNLYEKGWRMN